MWRKKKKCEKWGKFEKKKKKSEKPIREMSFRWNVFQDSSMSIKTIYEGHSISNVRYFFVRDWVTLVTKNISRSVPYVCSSLCKNLWVEWACICRVVNVQRWKPRTLLHLKHTIHRQLCAVYGAANVLLICSVERWQRVFKEGRTNVEDEDREIRLMKQYDACALYSMKIIGWLSLIYRYRWQPNFHMRLVEARFIWH